MEARFEWGAEDINSVGIRSPLLAYSQAEDVLLGTEDLEAKARPRMEVKTGQYSSRLERAASKS